MPIDVLYEVFQYVEPQTLMNLCRATKALRNILTRRSARSIWQRSLASVHGLPSTPDAMTEPAYVDLIWGRGCMFCGSLSNVTTSWYMRVRYCEECAREKYSYRPNHLEFPVLYQMLYIVSTDASKAAILPYIRVPCSQRGRRRSKKMYALHMMQNFEQELRLHQEGTYEAGGEWEKAATDWYEEKKQAFKLHKKHARLCEQWIAHRQADRLSDLERRRDIRQRAIEERLTGVGWGDELKRLPSGALAKRKSVRTVVPLNDKDWLSMRDNLVSFMVEAQEMRFAKEDRLYDLLETVYRDFCRSKTFRDVLPGIGDLATAPPITDLLNETPSADELCAEEVLDTLSTIPRSFFDAWQARCEQELIALLQEHLWKDPAIWLLFGINTVVTSETLRLASIVFRTRHGSSGIFYPDILAMSNYDEKERRQPWSTDLVVIDAEKIRQACYVVKLTTWDPRTTRIRDMDLLDPWFYHPADPRDEHGMRVVYPWRYKARMGSDGRQLAWLSLPETIMARHRVCSDEWTVQFSDGDALCAHCDSRFEESKELYDHLRDA
ncbi:hypothetical protein BD626DRAFT_571009 [Schizophyllum amplum]|uniref:F-box domain-containing protein n=1 Tax=Schizophyllum amplum TaxID=97359 RepID=A0A550C987_9AGAR|nr:hypothetical protein BD626DRAFT_571009 [Auriculariopsis ampla]